jgi:3,4-dihydroxy 2-butanone 4-phosphate synthase
MASSLADALRTGITNGTYTPTRERFDTIESAIAAFKAGQFIVVLDDESRENEGDLIIAAQDITAAQMAFMIRYTSGIICTPLTGEIADKLELPQMVSDNEDPNRTAYTISVDAVAELGVTTGISASDRSLTCRTLAAKQPTKDTLRRPGHVFPLRARQGGVLERTGHTEAAVDFCRLAGKREVGVICEMVIDGDEVGGKAEREGHGMMRRDECLDFGRRWGLRVVTIEDLVAYRLKTEGKGLEDLENGVNGH